jgi:hypothetical protein
MSRTEGADDHDGGRPRRHCLKYVAWEHVERWKNRARRAGGDMTGFYPYAYGSNDKAFRNFDDTVLWLLTLPRYDKYRLAPSIVARLEIDKIRTWETDADELRAVDPEVLKSGPIVVFADEAKSHYLPLNNAFQVLMGLRFRGDAPNLMDSYAQRDRSGEGEFGPYVSLAGHFQRHRWLDEASIPSLERYAATVLDGRRAFLSYRRRDFPRGADGAPSWPEALGTALAARSVSCWWDRWYLPQADEDDDMMPRALLTSLLDDAVTQAAWFIALVGPEYLQADDESWPRKEWVQAREEGGRHGRRHPMNRVAVFLSDRVDDEAHRRWREAGDRVLWAGPQPTADVVADGLANLMSTGSSQRRPR